MDTMLAALRAELATQKKMWPELATRCGVPLSTFRKVAYGHVKNPRVATVERMLRVVGRKVRK
jgi:predicted transcriptional regulator